MFVVADHLCTDKIARVATHLVRVFGEFNEAATRTQRNWQSLFAGSFAQARAEGDLRADVEPDTVPDTVVGALLGAELLARTSGRTDLRDRVARTWQLLLPAIVSDESLSYFREFLARESLRSTSSGGPGLA